MRYLHNPIPHYFGGKGSPGSYQTIINQIPMCHTYVEAMVGGGAVYRNLKLPATTVINDIDASVIDKYVDAGHGERDGVLITNLSWVDLIPKIDMKHPDGVVVYFDPPYLKSSRKSSVDVYNFEWTDQGHMSFIQYVLLMRCKVIISHYPCAFYDNWLTGWRTVDYKSMTRHGQVVERLYMNYPEPTFLQDTRYVGDDYLERQRIKRKASRWLANVDKMSPAERQAVLAAIIDKYA